MKGELFAYTDPILSALNDKLGDNLAKVRTLAEQSLLELSGHPNFGIGACLSILMRTTNPTASKDGGPPKKSMQSNKHIQGRYSVMQQILATYDIQERDLIRNCVQFALKGVQHSVAEVRTNAYSCMKELYRIVGPPIRKELEGLRPAQLEQVEAAFAEVDADSGQPRKAAAPKQQKETIMTNIDPHGNKPGAKKGGNTKVAKKAGGGGRMSDDDQ